MANTRPYWLVYKGEPHIIEATSPAAAVHHVVGADITELRAARASEVLDWSRKNKAIPVAGVKAPESMESPPSQGSVKVGEWLLANAETKNDDATKSMLSALGYAYGSTEQALTLEQFDIICAACPLFGDAIVAAIAAEGETPLEMTLSDVRGVIEEAPVTIDVVEGAVRMWTDKTAAESE